MDTGRTQQFPGITAAQVKAERVEKVTATVNGLPNLTDVQRKYVLDVCLAHVENHSGSEPHYGNVANLARSIIK